MFSATTGPSRRTETSSAITQPSDGQHDLAVLLETIRQNNYNLVEIEQELAKNFGQLDFFFLTPVGGDSSGDNILHMAVRQRKIELLEMLLSFDAPMDMRNHEGHTPLELAQTLLRQSEFSRSEQEDFKKAIGLLTSRSQWQHLGSENAFSINRTLYLLKHGINNTDSINNDIVMIYGGSQQGKSTLVNYLSGTDYEHKRDEKTDRTFATPIEDPRHPPRAKTGNGKVSETLFSSIYPLPEKDSYVLVDMPGFGDVRGEIANICVTLSRKIVLQKLTPNRGIKAVVLVISYAELIANTWFALRQRMAEIGNILENNKNIILMVTQTKLISPEAGTVKEKITNNLEEFDKQIQQDLKGTPDGTETRRMLENIKKVLTILKHDKRKVIVADIFTPTTRDEIFSLLDSYQSQPKASFNFTSTFHTEDDIATKKFGVVVNKLCESYEVMLQEQTQREKSVAVIEQKIDAHHEKIHVLEQKIEAEQVLFDTEITELTPTDHKDKEKLEEMLAELQTCISTGERAISEKITLRNTYKEEKDVLQSDDSIDPIDKVEQKWEQPIKSTWSGRSAYLLSLMLSGSKKTAQETARLHNYDACRIKHQHVSYKTSDERPIAKCFVTPVRCTFQPGVWNKRAFTSYGVPFVPGIAHQSQTEVATSAKTIFTDNLKKGKYEGEVNSLDDQAPYPSVSIIITVYGYKRDSEDVKTKVAALAGMMKELDQEIEDEQRIVIYRKRDLVNCQLAIKQIENKPAQERARKELIEFNISQYQSQLEAMSEILDRMEEDLHKAKENREQSRCIFLLNKESYHFVLALKNLAFSGEANIRGNTRGGFSQSRGAIPHPLYRDVRSPDVGGSRNTSNTDRFEEILDDTVNLGLGGV